MDKSTAPTFKPSAIAQVCYQNFVDVERKQFILDKAVRALSVSSIAMSRDASKEDAQWYFEWTTTVLREYEEKRRKAKL